MDNNENVHAEQRDRSEESQPDTSSDVEKIQQLRNEVKKNEAEIGSRKSNDSVKNGNGSRNFTEGQQYRSDRQQSENYRKMCEHSRDMNYQGNFSDGNAVNFDDENIWQPNTETYYQNYANDGIGFDVNCSNDPHRNCKSGINVSLVSRKELPNENIGIEKPICSVSFKRCYDNTSKYDNKRKKFFCSSRSKSKKSSKEEANRPAESDGTSNFRCTFENCCGNCESYIMEVPTNDCIAYKSWQNNNFESRNICFEDCCCPREMKVFPSSLNVRPQRSCGACVENRECCSIPNEPKIDFCDRQTSSKHFLQRVHFGKKKNCAEKKHSSCSFCSRKCTPSKASLFVEIGESIADVCNLTSGQVYQCDDSIESMKDDCGRKEYCFLKRNKSDILKGRRKKKHSDNAKCNPNCKGRPGAVTRCNSDRVAFVETCADDCVIEQTAQKAFCSETVERPSVCFQEVQECRSQTESCLCQSGATVDCKQQCGTSERSMLGDIRKGKLWTQLQDTYKTFVKAATTSICQIMKQSSKFKLSKKCAKDCLTRATSTKEREKSMCADQCNQSEVYNECLYEGTCWKKMMGQESNNVHCCRNVCCENVVVLSECQKPTCQNPYWKHKRNHQERSRRDWHFDPRNNLRANVYSFDKGSVKDSRCLKYRGTRKRGGGDSPNQKKRSNLNRRSNPNNGGQSSSTNNETNTRNEMIRQPVLENEQQTERATMHIDVTVQASAIRAVIDPSNAPFLTESLSYQKRIKTIKRLETYTDAITSNDEKDVCNYEQGREKQSGTEIREMDSSMQAVPTYKDETKQSKNHIGQGPKRTATSTSATSKYGASSPRTSASRSLKSDASKSASSVPRKRSLQKNRSATKQNKSKADMFSKEVQCTIISRDHVICGNKDEIIQVENLCYCESKVAVTSDAEKVEDKKDESADTSEATPAEDTSEEPIVEQPDDQDVERISSAAPDVIITPVDETKAAQVPEEKDTAEEPVTVDLTESRSKIGKEMSQLVTTPSKEITPATDPHAPVEFSREFNGKRTYVSVQMQTSNTILTQILSEFQEGNKKRQVLMSIKLQSNLDGQQEEASGSADVQGNGRNGTKKQSLMSEGPVDEQPRRMKRVSSSRAAHSKTKNVRGANGSTTDTFDHETSDDWCRGPCGRKR